MNRSHAELHDTAFDATRRALAQLKQDRLDAVAREHDRSATRAIRNALRDVHAAHAARLPALPASGALATMDDIACVLATWCTCGIIVTLTPRYAAGILCVDAAVSDTTSTT